jgi:hypothetical protein
MKQSVKLSLCLLIANLIGAAAHAQTLQWKAVWYSPIDSGFWRELSDTNVYSGNTISPQQQAVNNLYNGFCAIHNDLDANAVVVRLWDEDSDVGAYGGGFSYNPVNRQTINMAALEIVMNMAQQCSLKVIWEIELSSYHIMVDDTYGSYTGDGGAYEGSWYFIQQFFQPSLWYGNPCATYVQPWNNTSHTACIPNTVYNNDSRIAGWILSSNVDARQTAYYNWVNKYWGTFYNSLVHYNGYTSQFAGIYSIGSPSDSTTGGCGGLSADETAIDDFKSIFQQSGYYPDLFGLGWYGNGNDGTGTNYNFSCVTQDLETLVGWMMNDTYSVSASHIMLMEGGTDNYAGTGVGSFITTAVDDAASLYENSNYVTLAGIAFFSSDGFGQLDNYSCSGGGACVPPQAVGTQNSSNFAAFLPSYSQDEQMTTLPYLQSDLVGFHPHATGLSGCTNLSGSGAGYSYCPNGTGYTVFSPYYGTLSYSGGTKTTEGSGLESGFSSH